MKVYYEWNPNIDYTRDKLRWNGWGALVEDYEGRDKIPEILDFLRNETGRKEPRFKPFPELSEIPLQKPRLRPQDEKFFQNLCGKAGFQNSAFERIFHSYGRSYWDMVRLQWNQIRSFVDGVLYPRSAKEIQKALEYCKIHSIAVIPYGGGSSVVGGLEAIAKKNHKAILSMDLSKLDKFLGWDEKNLTAKFQAGIYGTKLESHLNEIGYTLGHFPQSFVYSTLGGWVACRSAGQQSNRYGKIEDMVVQLQVVTPEGIFETGDYPSHASGPDWKQILLGSEGLLGVLSEVKVRIHPLPERRLYFGILFPSFQEGMELIRRTNQEEISVAMLRLSDEEETRLFSELAKIQSHGFASRWKQRIQSKVLDWYGLKEKKCILLVGLEGREEEILSTYTQIRKLASSYKALYVGESIGKKWIRSRFQLPFLRNHILEYGFGVDTMETSAPYSQLDTIRKDFHDQIQKAIPESLSLCHISHSYVDGASLYFTVIFPMDFRDPLGQWKKLKKAASECFHRHGAAVSHHHGVGIDHKFWYEKETPDFAIRSLQELKKEWDPKEILNPGKLFHRIQ